MYVTKEDHLSWFKTFTAQYLKYQINYSVPYCADLLGVQGKCM